MTIVKKLTASNAANLLDILQADQILNLADDSRVAVPHIVRAYLVRRAVLARSDESSGREPSLTKRRESGQPDELLGLFGVLHARHEDAAGAGVERESDKFGGVAGDADEGNHGALRVVLDRADELDQQGCV